MKTDAVTTADLAGSVISVTPLARDAHGRISPDANRRIIAHMMAGGVTTFLYGGNANLYHVGVREFSDILEMLDDIAPKTGWVIPSIGPDFGKAMEQAAILKSFDFPTAMALPMASATRPAGIATGFRKIAEAFGRPITAYVRAENYFSARDMASLVADGAVCTVKYAVDRKDTGTDAYLSALIDAVGASRIVSGMGERPAIVHMQKFGLASFTSGSVTIAPHLSAAMLTALKAGDYAAAEQIRAKFLPFEDQRDMRSQIVVLHDGVRLAGIAETGPLSPFLANLETEALEPVATSARALLDENERFARKAAA
jgi:dihydrodipicolinate synthase/N-acetylneuraminate lyase